MQVLKQEPRVTFPNRKRDLNAIGINVYGGGFTLGVLKHFHVLGQWEEFKLGRRSFLLNFPNIASPFSEWDKWPVDDFFEKADLVYANPPCVPWSSASSYAARTGQVGTRFGKTVAHRFSDPLLALTDHTMKTAMELRPRVFISESVENAYNTGVRHYDQYVEAWQQRGYAVTFFLTDAIIHGAPCKRRRFHFIAHDVALKLPKEPKNFTVRTVRDAIGDLAKVPLKDEGEFQHFEAGAGAWNRPDYRKYLKRLKPLGSLKNSLSAEELEMVAAPSILCRKLHWDLPTPTILGFNKLIHPDGGRWITFREGMRLMTYPDEFRVAGKSDVDAYDAVIPLIGEMLAKMARKSIEAGGNQKPTHQVVDWRPLGVGHSGVTALKRRAA